jgi:hypothetical protein
MLQTFVLSRILSENPFPLSECALGRRVWNSFYNCGGPLNEFQIQKPH